MGRTKSHKKNIACLESLWDGNIESRLSVVPLLELEKGNDAEAALDVAVPERFQAGDVLLVALRPTHLLTIVGPHPRFHQAWPMARSCPPARCPEVLDISASASGLARCCRELGRAATVRNRE